MYDVSIVGGGLAGLINANLLSRAGLKVVLFEKNIYPFHRVCGEYISKEVIPFLENHDLFPTQFDPPTIDELEISDIKGKSFIQQLDLGGFGISRFVYDQWLLEKAIVSGVEVHQNTKVTSVKFSENQFIITTNKSAEPFISRLTIGAQGKRSKLDQSLKRSFLNMKSPYVGVKYHINMELSERRISLHNFQGGYCGVSRVEDNKYNLCYLAHRDPIRKHGDLDGFEKAVMQKNPHLQQIFENAEFLLDKPEVINEITFDKKEPVFDHIFMCGDAAGMITPLCGNGMAMAIHSAKILSELIIASYKSSKFNREKLESDYAQAWRSAFALRLWSGRKIQGLFGTGSASSLGVIIGKYFKPVSKFLITQTHGNPFS